MKRIFYIAMIMVLAVSCSKTIGIESENDTTGNNIQFALGSDSRVDLVSSWTVGESVAIFKYTGTTPADSDQPSRFKVVSTSGELEAYSGSDNIASDGSETTNYMAIYPYVEANSNGYKDYAEDCEASFSLTDIISSTSNLTASTNTVTFSTFSHQFTNLYLEISTGEDGDYFYESGFSSVSTLFNIDGNTYTVDSGTLENVGSYSVSIFTQPQTSIPDIATATFTINGSTVDKYITSLESDDCSSWDAGKVYSYGPTVLNRE